MVASGNFATPLTLLRAVDAAPERPPDVLVTAVTLGPDALDGRALAAELRRRAPGLAAASRP